MILAIVLSALVILGWGFIAETWFPAANPPSTKVEKGRPVAVPQPQADPAADTPRAPAGASSRTGGDFASIVSRSLVRTRSSIRAPLRLIEP